MKCTECGSKVKPVVAVDIDGTLGMYHEHFTEFASGYVDRQLKRGYDGGNEFSDYLGMEKQSYREAKLAYRQGGMKRTMPLYSGARSFMHSLRDHFDVEIWIATTRPWMRLDNIDPDTREWLHRNSIEYDYMIYGEDKYQILVERVSRERIIMVTDDLMDQCYTALMSIGGSESDRLKWPVCQPTRVHNSKQRFPNRYYSFDDLLKNIDTRLEAWDGNQ